MSLHQIVARQTIIQIIGKAVSTLLGLVAMAALTRSLGPEKFGWYVTAASFLQFIGIASDFGFTVVTSNLLSEPNADKNSILGTLMSWRLITAGVLNGFGPLLILLFPYPAPIRLAVAVLSLSFFLNNINQVFIGYFRERLKILVIVLSEVAGRLVLVVGVLLLYHRGFLPLMAVITLGTVANSVYLFWCMGPIRLMLNRAVSRILFYKMWPTALAIIFNACYLQADRLILPLYTSQATVGQYGAAYRVLDVVIQVSAIIMGMVMPLVTHAWSRGDMPAFKERYQLGFDLLCLIVLPMAAGLAALSEPIMRLIAGPNFSEAGYFLRLLSLSIVGTCFGQIFGHLALAINRQKECLFIFASDALISVPLYFLTIQRYGVYGAIGTTLFSEVYAGILLTVITVHYSKTLPRLHLLLTIIFACTVMYAGLTYFKTLPLLAAIVFGALLYGVVLLAFGAVTLKMIKELLQLKKVVDLP